MQSCADLQQELLYSTYVYILYTVRKLTNSSFSDSSMASSNSTVSTVNTRPAATDTLMSEVEEFANDFLLQMDFAQSPTGYLPSHLSMSELAYTCFILL